MNGRKRAHTALPPKAANRHNLREQAGNRQTTSKRQAGNRRHPDVRRHERASTGMNGHERARIGMSGHIRPKTGASSPPRARPDAQKSSATPGGVGVADAAREEDDEWCGFAAKPHGEPGAANRFPHSLLSSKSFDNKHPYPHDSMEWVVGYYILRSPLQKNTAPYNGCPSGSTPYTGSRMEKRVPLPGAESTNISPP